MFLYAIGSPGAGRIRDCNASPRRCFCFEEVSRILPAPHAIKWRNKGKSLLLHHFWSMLIHVYRVQLGCVLQLTHFDKGQPWTTFQQMRLRKQTNKQLKKQTWHNHNSVAEKTLRFSFFLYDKVCNAFFRLLSSESPLLIFNKIARYNRFDFISSYGRR